MIFTIFLLNNKNILFSMSIFCIFSIVVYLEGKITHKICLCLSSPRHFHPQEAPASRPRRTVDESKTSCLLHLHADHLYYQRFKSVEAVVAQVTHFLSSSFPAWLSVALFTNLVLILCPGFWVYGAVQSEFTSKS